MHHTTPDINRSHCACTALRRASRAVTRLYDGVMAGTGMSLAQLSMIRNIGRNEPIPLSQLAELLIMDRTTLYRALKPIERDGWVAIDDGKGRSKTARLTDLGRLAMNDAAEAWELAQHRLLGRLGLNEWAEIEASLDGLVAIATEELP